MEENTILSNSEIKSKAKKALKGNWGIAIITFIISNMILYCGSFIHHMNRLSNASSVTYTIEPNRELLVTIVAMLPYLILNGPMTYGISKFSINLVRDGSHKIEDIFRGFKYFVGTFSINILLTVYKFLWILLFLLPLFIIRFIILIDEITQFNIFCRIENYLNEYVKALLIILLIVLIMLLIRALILVLLRYSMSYYIYIDNPDVGAMEAVKKSFSMMKENTSILFFLYLSFILWYILGMLTLGIGFLWMIPYVKSAEAVFYDELKKNNESSNEEVISTL
ncbi:TPA: DUF975 family protein [Clostridium botulinum]|nr:DUF975 family protein [Clostridium botulinum]